MTFATISFNLVNAVTAYAGSAAAGYPATNALTTQTKKSWRSTGTANDYIELDFGSNIQAAGYMCCLNAHNIPLANISVLAGPSTPPTFSIPAPTGGGDNVGRFKASLIFPAGTAFRYLRIAIAAGSTLNGLPYWEIGSVLLFATVWNLAKDPLYGNSGIDSVFPQSRIDLDNGVVVRDDTGPPFSLISLDFSAGSDIPIEVYPSIARSGLSWLDLNDAKNPGRQWPVRYHEPKLTRKLQAYNRETETMVFKEEV